MPGTSQHIASHLLNRFIGGDVAFAPAGTLYLALATVIDPTTGFLGDGTITEPDPVTEYVGYARAAIISNAANWPPRTDGTLRNGTRIVFPTSGGGASSPVSISRLVLMDSPTIGVGVMYAAAYAPGGLVVAAGDTPSFEPDTLGFVIF